MPSSPLDPTYSPSREGTTPIPDEKSTAWSSSGAPITGSIPSPFIGRVLAGRWEVGRRIGIGGMASVHEGLDRRLARPVAIKILHPHVAENPDSRERLAREARAIAQLKHENVIEVYDYAIDDPECTWLVTELIDGASLRQIVDRIERPMPEVAVMIVAEVVRALRSAHAMGIVHRDVKPDNILVGSAGRPKLSDFGIAQIVNEQRMTITGNLVGSPSYMSPEQANGRRTDHRTDLFSAGILLYRLVTGTLPFRGGTAIETIRNVSAGEYTDPVDLEAGCAGAVAGIIRRALAVEMDDRYGTADEMLHDLTQVLQDSGLSSTWEELPRFFADPSGYQSALRPRLAKELEARGKALLDGGDEGRAVDCFNRALSLGEGNQRTLDLVRELSKRRGKGRIRRLIWATGVAVGAVAMISGVLLVTDRLLPSDAATPVLPPEPAAIAKEAPPPSPEPARAVAAEPQPEQRPLEPIVEERSASKAPRATKRKKEHEPAPPRSTMLGAALPPRETATPAQIAPVTAPEPPREAAPAVETGTLHVGSKYWVDVFVDGKKLGRAPEQSRFQLAPGPHHVRAAKPNCMPYEEEFTISAGKTTRLSLQVVCP